MAKYEQIRKVLEKEFQDGKAHEIRELREKCAASGIDMETDRNAVNNVIFTMKKNGYLVNGERKGEYQLTEAVRTEKEGPAAVPGEEIKTAAELDWNQFFVLSPQKARMQEMKVSIVEKGEIRLNAILQKKILSRKLEIIMSKDYKTILLNPDGANAHEFTKAGTVKNKEIVERLRKMKLTFPVTYIIQWDEKFGMWRGELETADKK